MRVHPIPGEVQPACDALLLRVLDVVDRELPAIRSLLFGADNTATLCELFEAGSLEYSCREPAINVYRESGEFNPHKDHQALTVLIPLSDPDDFRGGGTGFWGPDSRGHRVEPAAVVLRPPRGSALVFGGHVIHAGMQVEAGVRVAYVASFSARGRCGRAAVGD